MVTYVDQLPLSIQRGFRRKLLTLLLLQLCLTVLVGYCVRSLLPEYCRADPDPDTAGTTLCTPGITYLFPAQSVQTLILGAACLIALPSLTWVRDRHPWNLICTTIWTVFWGVFLAAAQVEGGVIRSNTLFVMMGSCAGGVFCLLLLSTTFDFYNEETGERELMSFASAGTLSWIVMIAVAIVVYSQTTHLYEAGGHFVGGLIAASAIFIWVSYDANKLCKSMQPDDYMKGVTYFYTDFLLVCCCCLCAGFFAGGAS